ncbi:phosphoadenosine phosphosulfate reductase [Novosphingobium nitrogenifigens DSM 19370]|uniref:Adenosine 5'-phosphosulfate reductase n=1 Tax=Novosphingobium nitrogenifigens DSM 19370 TaxID=983920 RepID=F1ZDA5_9SPHN|nr:phosphoadenylyl-sulfate reductase [Novosphingobium nitrogenifigens]EGD57453.1 phosphoadenosine phosphosulfate reductase [Novosphingobium nitrogenifigens DSM 19370]
MADIAKQGSAERRVDRLDLGPRFTESDAIRLNNLFRGSDTREMLRTVIRDQLAGDLAVVSSFGAESAVLLHLVAEVDTGVPVLFLDTLKHFPETLAYRDRLVAHLGLTNVRVLTPDADVLAKKDENGLRWSWDPDGCCEIRKVVPLARALAGFDASITGRKGFQSKTRAGLPRFEIDASDAQGRLKINPLANWSGEDIEAWFAAYDLPRHPLVEQGYPSIGCAPCTSRVAEGEDPRSGRWKGWDKTECGIHVPGHKDDGDDLPPGYEPVF